MKGDILQHQHGLDANDFEKNTIACLKIIVVKEIISSKSQSLYAYGDSLHLRP